MVGQGEGNYNVQVTFDSLYILYIEHVECMWPVREKEIIMYIYIYTHHIFYTLEQVE